MTTHPNPAVEQALKKIEAASADRPEIKQAVAELRKALDQHQASGQQQGVGQAPKGAVATDPGNLAGKAGPT